MMRSPRVGAIWVFRAAAAVTAAALVDPIVEQISNTGVFGPGPFTDRSNLDVAPALLVAIALCCAFLFVWLRRCGCEVPARPLWTMLPSIFALQLGVLFVMETLEQIALFGHALGGSLWLGGPLALSMTLHLIGCGTVTCVLSWALRRSAQKIVHIVRCALEFLLRLGDSIAPRLCAQTSLLHKCIEPYLRALQGRAPPYLPAVSP